MTFALIHDITQNSITGSDQFIRLDARQNIFNQIASAKNQASKLLKIRSDIYSIRIYKGSISNNFPISGYHTILNDL